MSKLEHLAPAGWADARTLYLQVDDLLQTCLQTRHVAVAMLSGYVVDTASAHKHLLPGYRFDVITDKGTLDAVGLMANSESNRWTDFALGCCLAAANIQYAASAGLHKQSPACRGTRDLVTAGQSISRVFGHS